MQLDRRTCSSCSHWVKLNGRYEPNGVVTAECDETTHQIGLVEMFRRTKGSDTCGQHQKIGVDNQL